MSLRPDATLDKFAHRGDGRLPGLIGVRFTGVAENRIDAELDIRPELLAPNGYLHAATVIALAVLLIADFVISAMVRSRRAVRHAEGTQT